MESFTVEIEDKTCAMIKEVEDMAGMTQYIASGMAKLRIEGRATRKQERIDSCQDTVVRVNKY